MFAVAYSRANHYYCCFVNFFVVTWTLDFLCRGYGGEFPTGRPFLGTLLSEELIVSNFRFGAPTSAVSNPSYSGGVNASCHFFGLGGALI